MVEAPISSAEIENVAIALYESECREVAFGSVDDSCTLSSWFDAGRGVRNSWRKSALDMIIEASVFMEDTRRG